MPLPAWMTTHRIPTPATHAETWEGKPLVSRTPVSDVELHFRTYNEATGELLSFGSIAGPGSLNGVVQDALRTQAKHPTARLYTGQFSGPVY